MVSFSKKWHGWSFWKKLCFANVAVLVLVLVIGMVLIVPDCTFDCEARGQLLGQGLAQFLIFMNLVAVAVHFIRKNRKV